MEYQQKAYFHDTDDDVPGMFVIEVRGDVEQYRIAEKWLRPERGGGPTWITYWISEQALQDREDDGAVTYRKQVSDKQFKGVLKLAGVEGQVEVAS